MIEHLANRWFITDTRAVTISPATGTIVWLPNVFTSMIFDWNITNMRKKHHEKFFSPKNTSNLPCLSVKYWRHLPKVSRCSPVVHMCPRRKQYFHLINKVVGLEHKSVHSFSQFHPFLTAYFQHEINTLTVHVCFQNKRFLRLCKHTLLSKCAELLRIWIKSLLLNKIWSHLAQQTMLLALKKKVGN